VLLSRSDARAAAKRFAEAAVDAKYFYAAWFDAGVASEAARDDAAAEAHYRQALALRPDYGAALCNLSQLLRRTGRAADAAALVADALAKSPEKAGPHVAAAQQALEAKSWTTVEKEALAALKTDERNVTAMYLMARMFRASGRIDTARFALDNALALERGNAQLQLELGRVLTAQKENKLALVAYEKAARLRPTLLEAQECYGLALLREGLATEAVRVLETVVSLDPTSARARLHHGNALRATKQHSQAEAAYQKALELQPTLGAAMFNLGLLYVDNVLPGVDEVARLQKAVVSLRAFLSTNPDAVAKKRAEEYVEATDKRISKELKRREREEKRKRDDAAAPPAEPKGDK
jgi:tetratricopeptide (TPR) repeat protein